MIQQITTAPVETNYLPRNLAATDYPLIRNYANSLLALLDRPALFAVIVVLCKCTPTKLRAIVAEAERKTPATY